MKVSAKGKSTGKEQEITIKYFGGLLEVEIEKMVREAEQLQLTALQIPRSTTSPL